MKKSGILSLILALLELAGLIIAIVFNGITIMGYYTQESNVVMMIAAFVYAYYCLIKKEMPRWAATFKYVATCLVTVTFIVVVFVFVPMCLPNKEYALSMVFKGANFFHHFTCPIFAVVTYMFIDKDSAPTMKDSLTAMLPTLLYAIVSTGLNVLKVVEGPYPFLYVYKQPVWASVMWFFAIPLGGFLFALLIRFIKIKIASKER